LGHSKINKRNQKEAVTFITLSQVGEGSAYRCCIGENYLHLS